MFGKFKQVSPSKIVALESIPSGRRTIIRNDITSGSVKPTQGVQAVSLSAASPIQPIKKRTLKKSRIKSSTVAVYVGVFALIISVVGIGYYMPEKTATAQTEALANVSASNDQPAVNDVIATNIAATVAEAADLAVAPNVAELAVSTRVQSQYQSAGSDNVAISKPTIMQLSSASRSISTYNVKEGDTVSSVAAAYGLSADTIKWANNLTGDTVAVGSTLDILPRDGIAYTVKTGDTIESIASRYKADASLITTYNDLELGGVSAGLKIVVPSGVLPETERPGYVAPRAAVATTGTFITGYSSGFSNGSTWFIRRGTPNNGRYAFGNCTAYVFDRRAELGRPIGPMWGNAGSWAVNARNAGYQVDRNPEAGAVIQDWGHVAIVEAILPNGDLQLSEMNAAVAGGGYNIVSGRILPASQIGQYYYIH